MITSQFTSKLQNFNRIKSADNVHLLNFNLGRQAIKEQLLAIDLTWIIEPKINSNQQIFGGVALGNLPLGQKQEELIRLNFGAIVSVFQQTNSFINPKFKHLRVFFTEHSRQSLNQVFTNSSEFIESNLANANVLIYSNSVQSKSLLVVAAYLMKQLQISAREALQTIQIKRKFHQLDECLSKELIQYQNYLGYKPLKKYWNLCEIM